MENSPLTKEIATQIEQYKSVAASIRKLESTIQYQERIEIHHVIPRKFRDFRPTHLTIFQPPNNVLHNNFEKEYNHIFFSHLHQVITANKVTLELKKQDFKPSYAQLKTQC